MAEPAQRLYPYITRDRSVRGGQAVIEGTRIPVATIVRSHQQGMDLDEILVQFPSLEPQHLHAALLYYFDNRSEIDTLLGQSEQAPAGAIER